MLLLYANFFLENPKNLGRSDDAKWEKKEDGLKLTRHNKQTS